MNKKKNFFNNYILCRQSLLYHQIVLNNNFNLNMGRSPLLITHDKLLSKARKYSLFVTLRGTFCSIIIIVCLFLSLSVLLFVRDNNRSRRNKKDPRKYCFHTERTSKKVIFHSFICGFFIRFCFSPP